MTDRVHHPDCAWQRTTPAECEYRETFRYCPHPEHVCDCAEIEADRVLGEMGDGLRASSNSAATCYVCGHDAGDNWFDRTLCACDTMHTRCCNCGAALDDCPYEQVEPHAIPNSEAKTSRSADRANAAEQGQGEAGYDPGRTTRNRVVNRAARVAHIFRANGEDKVQLDVMQAESDRVGGGALLLNLPYGHGLEPGDVVSIEVSR